MHIETYEGGRIKEAVFGKNVACIRTGWNILFRNAIRQEASWETSKWNGIWYNAGPYRKIIQTMDSPDCEFLWTQVMNNQFPQKTENLWT